MNFKTIAYTLLTLFVAFAVGAFAYFYTKITPAAPVETGESDSRSSQQVTSDLLAKKSEKEPKIVTPFFIKEASAEYATLNKKMADFATENAENTAKPNSAVMSSIQNELLVFGLSDTSNDKEAAYALNAMNMLFVIGFDAPTFEQAITGTQFEASYNKHLAFIKKFPKKKVAGLNGSMYASNDVTKSYAAQKTMADINQASIDAYPTSYGMLRKNLNSLQADTMLYTNYVTGKPYKTPEDVLKGEYGPEYMTAFKEELAPYMTEEKMYEGTGASSYEVNIMYAMGVLWPEFIAIQGDAKKKDAQSIVLKEILSNTNAMILKSHEYNTGRLFYGYVIAAFIKSRVVHTGVLSKEESTKEYTEAINGFKRTTDITLSKNQLKFWLSRLPKNGWMYLEMQKMAKDDKTIQEYVASLSK